MANRSVEQLKELVDPSILITSLGFNIYYDNSDEIRAACAIHGGDNKTGFCFKKSSRRFYCFTHGCDTDPSGEVNNDIISLVMKVNKCSFVDAVKFLSELTGFDVDLGKIDPLEEKKLRVYKDKKKFVEGTPQPDKAVSSVSESLVKQYQANGCPYFSSVGVDSAMVKSFELGTMTDRFGIERATIPIRDAQGHLLSISGRRTDGDREPRYRLVKDFKKSRVLYNLNNALEYRDIYEGVVVIVEGFKACWHVVSSGIPCVVAVMGRVISPDQINLLVRYGFVCSLLLLDGDEKGKAGMGRSTELMKGKMDVKPIYLPDDVSPDDVEYNDLFDLINSFL